MIIHTPWALRTFLSTLSLRRATPRLSRVVPTPIFLSTLSLRRATSCGLASHQIQKHFYPRSPCGERHTKREVAKRTTDNFYPRSPCGERPTGPTPVPIAPYFYPRSPCGERPLSLLRSVIFIALFLSTLSLRRATTETRIFRTGCVFLSTLSLRRATFNIGFLFRLLFISIHALLAESDRPSLSCTARHTYFYPRSPCGERLSFMLYNTSSLIFLSTLSLRRATVKKTIAFYPPIFLSTLSLRRATRLSRHLVGVYPFLSTLSLRRATISALWMVANLPLFLSTLSLRRATRPPASRLLQQSNFYPRSPCGERPIGPQVVADRVGISIHALLAESDTPTL